MVLISLLATSCAGGGGGGGGGGSNSGDPNDEDGPGKFEAGSTMETIQKRKKLLVGLPLDEPPFSSRNPRTGAIEGFDVEIAKEIARGIFGSKLENRIQFLEIDPRDRELQLESNKIDIAMGRYEISVARKKFVDFAGPYYVAHQSAVVGGSRLGRTVEDLDSLLDLAGRKVCAVQGSTDVVALQQQAPGVDASTVRNTVQECAVLLKDGVVSAVVADYVDLQPLIADREFDDLPRFAAVPYGIGVHKGTDDFRQYINERLDNEIAEVWSDLYSRTIGVTGADDDQPPTDRY